MRRLRLREEKWWVSAASKQECSPGPHDSKAVIFYYTIGLQFDWALRVGEKFLQRPWAMSFLNQCWTSPGCTSEQVSMISCQMNEGDWFWILSAQTLGRTLPGEGGWIFSRLSFGFQWGGSVEGPVRWFSRGSAHRLIRNLHAESAALNFHGRRGEKRNCG